MEEPIRFDSGGLTLQGLLGRGNGPAGAVITHPHPLYGGDMYNPVVECLQGVFQNRGYTTLRFNFRGVGKSEGRYDDGNGEAQDVLSAMRHLQTLGVSRFDLAGYSFGTWVNARIPDDPDVIARSTMVSPPVAFIDFSDGAKMPNLSLVVTGSRDEIAPAAQIRPLLSQWNPDVAFEIIEGADHFYWGHLDVLREVLARHVPPAL